MSGTSADAVDAALVSIDDDACKVISSLQLPLPHDVRKNIIDLFDSGADEIDRMGELDIAIARLFAEAALLVVKQAGLSNIDITAIGSHGQTIRHRPRRLNGMNFTLQIGDPNTIAQLTGITTVADFRRRDMAAGGQGAPLVPAFHRAVFSQSTQYRIVLNIGGIANITVLLPQGSVLGYDTGPGNGLMDAWIARCTGEKIDVDGSWARGGNASPELLKVLYSHSFFSLSTPKSTGREEFSLSWLLTILKAFPTISDQDVQATLLELTARSIADQISRYGERGDVLVCGGGAHNSTLIQRIRSLLPEYKISTTDEHGIPVDYVEAAAFAWLAMRTLSHLPGNIPAVTGAQEEVILGGIYPRGVPR